MGKFFSHTPQGQDSNPHGPYVLKYLCSQELNQLLARTSASRGHISSGNDSQLELGHIIKSGTIRDRNQVKHPIPSLAEFHALQERTGSTDGVSHHTNYSSRNKNFRLFSDSLRMGSFIKARRSRASRFCPHGYQSICSQELNQLQTEISSEDTFFKEPKGTLQ
jgi:hypothetical protein